MTLLILGTLLFTAQGCIAALSLQFVFGQGYAARPIPEFLLLEFFSFACYFLAVAWLRCDPTSRLTSKGHLRIILIVAIACRLVRSNTGASS